MEINIYNLSLNILPVIGIQLAIILWNELFNNNIICEILIINNVFLIKLSWQRLGCYLKSLRGFRKANYWTCELKDSDLRISRLLYAFFSNFNKWPKN